jgi:peptidoglycan lytic transglycosylase
MQRGSSPVRRLRARGTRRLHLCAVAAALLLLGTGSRTAQPKPAEAAAGWPHILGAADAERYRALFKLQRQGLWAAADAVAIRLQDRLLMGHVLAQRYLDRKYKARYAELAAWLGLYADHGEARAIHALAMARRPKDVPPPPAPAAAPIAWRGTRDDPAGFRPALRARRHGSALARNVAARIKTEIRLEARRDPMHAEELLAVAGSRHALADDDYDEARADVAEGLLSAKHYRAALRLAGDTRTEPYRPLAHWVAGLADWGLGRLDDARTHFEMLARLPNMSPWNTATAAFWAARVHAAAHRRDLAEYWLGEAAAAPRTFYGMLARSLLGEQPYRAPEPALPSAADITRICEIPAGKRALALLQIGERGRAQTELRVLIAHADPAVIAALVPLADRANLPAISLELAARVGDRRLREAALYPVPHWRPKGGYRLDRALLLAFMRQESEFRPDNRSPAGAIGLMQVMWGTARQVAKEVGLSLSSPEALREPAINLALGQAYLRDLLKQHQIAGNLVLLAAAYNRGPAWFSRRSTMAARPSDPLFFLETIAPRETRIFVERVLANYWIYQRRLGHPARGLGRLAAGDWPVYVDGVAAGSTSHAAR